MAEEVATYTFTKHPKVLEKKVMIMQKFRDFLEGNFDSDEEGPFKEDFTDQVVYVKKWLRTKHAYAFRLSNRIVQACFLDGSEMIIHLESKLVTGYDRNKQKETFSQEVASLSSNGKMVKRL